jgi:hypothetical protein
MTIDKTSWENLTHNGPGTASQARHRITLAFDNDPFIAMLAPEIRATMIEGFLLAMKTRPFHKVEDAISAYSLKSVAQDAERAMRYMPMGFLTKEFKEHVVDLVKYAIIPHPDYNDPENH